jgi:uncharacterized protein with PIN domain
VGRLALFPSDVEWLSRCLDCNARLASADRQSLERRVPAHVFASHTEFMVCPGCGKVYWSGSHADRMVERLRRLTTRGGEE